MTDRCEIPRCRGEVSFVYLGHGICESHWNQYTAEGVPHDRLRMVLGIGDDAPTATEEAMTTKKKTTKKAAPKKTRTTKPKAAKPKKERPPKEDLVVFACRVAQPEREAFHKATGPAGASRFARKLMVAFANEDEPGFRALIKEARELRG